MPGRSIRRVLGEQLGLLDHGAAGQFLLAWRVTEALGCAVTPSGVMVDAQQMTIVPGGYACGEVTKGNQLAFAVQGGAMAAMKAGYAIFYDPLCLEGKPDTST